MKNDIEFNFGGENLPNALKYPRKLNIYLIKFCYFDIFIFYVEKTKSIEVLFYEKHINPKSIHILPNVDKNFCSSPDKSPNSIENHFGVLIPSFSSIQKVIYLTENPTSISISNKIHLNSNTHQKVAQITKQSNGTVILSRYGNQAIHLNDVPMTASSELKSGDKLTILGKSVYFDYPIETPSEMDLESESNTNKLTKESILKEFDDMAIDSDCINESFDNIEFPLNPGFVQAFKNLVRIYLMNPSYLSYTEKLQTITRKILLNGPSGSELMQDAIIRALAKEFKAKLLFIDDNELENRFLDTRDMYTAPSEEEMKIKNNDTVFYCKKSSGKLIPNKKAKVIRVLKDPRKVAIVIDRPTDDNHVIVVDQSLIKAKLEPFSNDNVRLIIETFEEWINSRDDKIIVYFKGPNNYIRVNAFKPFKKLMDRCEKRVIFVCASLYQEMKHKREKIALNNAMNLKPEHRNMNILCEVPQFENLESPERKLISTNRINSEATKISTLFTTKLRIPPPDDVELWQKKLNIFARKWRHNVNTMFLNNLLRKNKLICKDTIRHKLFSKKNYTYREMDHIIAYAITDSLTNYPETTVIDSESRLVISGKSILAGIESCDTIFNVKSNDSVLDNIQFENEYEKKLAEEVIPKNEINVTFDDIGALENVKQVLKELVMLPLQRPELFHGNLVKPCKGILLFGPPGTGKTMLAKAIATESGANFINIPMSSLTSKWFGDAEKYTKAIFTLASKLSPCVVFIDEVDSFLGQRGKSSYEHEAMRKMKNEFMSLWDGLKSNENERILILAATNRPFDLDEAVLRRMPRRLLVDLPDLENREKIFKVILSKEELEDDVDMKELALMTEGFSGSDIKNMCIEAAHEPIRDYIKNEKTIKPVNIEESVINEEEDDDESFWTDDTQNKIPKLDPPLRKIKMDDFRAAKKKISPSVQENSKSIEELREWNERYGEGGSRTKFTPSYFM